MIHSYGGHEWIDVRAVDGKTIRIPLDQVQHIQPTKTGCDVYLRNGGLLMVGEDLTKRLTKGRP